MKTEIPHSPLDIRHNCSGIRHVDLHRRDGLFVQESSYGHFWFLGTMVFVAVVVCLLPWNTVASYGIKLKYVVAGGLAWGGICMAIPFFLRNAFGQTIIIDPHSRTLRIRQRRKDQIMEWRDILGVQICHQKAPDDPELNGYQLNLVWKATDEGVKRHCLVKHTSKRFVESLARRYQSEFHFECWNSGE